MSSLVEQANLADTSFQNLPIIDLGDITSKDVNVRRTLVEQVRNACLSAGFFVTNHGIPDTVVEGALSTARQYFSLPVDTKMELDYRNSPNFRGYYPLLSGNSSAERGKNVHEGFALGWEPLESELSQQGAATGGSNVWVSDEKLPEFRKRVLQYYHAAVRLGKHMFPLFAQALNEAEDFFEEKTQESAALMKLLHYPPQLPPIDYRDIGISAHTDWECFTILLQEPGIQALQVLNAKGEWIEAPALPGTLVINIGDQLARWTNDVFKSTTHRAVNLSGAERYSIPLFFGTDYGVKLEPIASCISPEQPPKYEVMTAGEYVRSRLAARYGNNGTY
ncbi:Clavaminate synthase-like protein [Cyathus striatus]|nr:Clavaminate synthase-like protein [Cyathus striatus]